MMQLKGLTIRQTKKAILFHVKEDELGKLEGQTHWFPQSNVKLIQKTDTLDVLRMPDWLYDSKVTITPGSE